MSHTKAYNLATGDLKKKINRKKHLNYSVAAGPTSPPLRRTTIATRTTSVRKKSVPVVSTQENSSIRLQRVQEQPSSLPTSTFDLKAGLEKATQGGDFLWDPPAEVYETLSPLKPTSPRDWLRKRQLRNSTHQRESLQPQSKLTPRHRKAGIWPEPDVKPKISRRVERKIEPRVDSMSDPRARIGSRFEAWAEPREEVWVEPSAEPRIEPRVERSVEQTIHHILEPTVESKVDLQIQTCPHPSYEVLFLTPPEEEDQTDIFPECPPEITLQTELQTEISEYSCSPPGIPVKATELVERHSNQQSVHEISVDIANIPQCLSYEDIRTSHSCMTYPSQSEVDPSLSNDRTVVPSKSKLSFFAITSSPEDTENEDVNEDPNFKYAYTQESQDYMPCEALNFNHQPFWHCVNKHSCQRNPQEKCPRAVHMPTRGSYCSSIPMSMSGDCEHRSHCSDHRGNYFDCKPSSGQIPGELSGYHNLCHKMSEHRPTSSYVFWDDFQWDRFQSSSSDWWHSSSAPSVQPVSATSQPSSCPFASYNANRNNTSNESPAHRHQSSTWNSVLMPISPPSLETSTSPLCRPPWNEEKIEPDTWQNVGAVDAITSESQFKCDEISDESDNISLEKDSFSPPPSETTSDFEHVEPPSAPWSEPLTEPPSELPSETPSAILTGTPSRNLSEIQSEVLDEISSGVLSETPIGNLSVIQSEGLDEISSGVLSESPSENPPNCLIDADDCALWPSQSPTQGDLDKGPKEDVGIANVPLVPEDTIPTVALTSVFGTIGKKATPFTMTVALSDTPSGPTADTIHGDGEVSGVSADEAEEPRDAGDANDRLSGGVSTASSAGISDSDMTDVSASTSERSPSVFVPSAFRTSIAKLPLALCVVALSIGTVVLYQNQTI